MYQTGDTIKNVLYQIENHQLVLPAIQREFVWSPEQISRLFDSLMQGYPFGTFLYWRIRSENSLQYNYYDFVLNFHQRDAPHCPPFPLTSQRDLTAVLDGQQRLTALNIGLRGSISRKLPYMWWNNPAAFPRRHLYLDLLWESDDNEGLMYRFDFLTDEQANAATDDECWFLVNCVLTMKGGPSMVRWLNQHLPQDRVDRAYETLDRLFQVVHNEQIVAFYEEHSQDLEKVLQIFIRMNSGGTILSYSDLLLSIAVAQWSHHDAREEIHLLVDELNRLGNGFSFSKDFVLKAGLMLSDIGNLRFKVANFNRDNMAVFERNWDKIKHSLILTVQLISSFGFTDHTLSAHNSVLPIAYYLFRKCANESYLTHSRHEEDRLGIRTWLVRSLLKASGIWGSGLDTLLTVLRNLIRESSCDPFPLARIREEMARRGKSLSFESEEFDDLVDTSYSDRNTFALLSLIFPSVDTRNLFHIDHIVPATAFTKAKLIDAGICPKKIEWHLQNKDRLANLQLLEGALNNEKRARMPHEWLNSTIPGAQRRNRYLELHMIDSLPRHIREFERFYINRRARLKEEIVRILR